MRPFLCDFLRVEGISPHRALDKLAQRGVRVYDAQKAGIAALNFAVRSKDTEKVFAIFSRSCYTVIKTGQSRAKRLLAAVRRRPGFVCGAVLFCLFSFAADRVILRIDVAGSAARYAERAEEVLAAAGLGVFSLYSADAADGARAHARIRQAAQTRRLPKFQFCKPLTAPRQSFICTLPSGNCDLYLSATTLFTEVMPLPLSALPLEARASMGISSVCTSHTIPSSEMTASE